MKITRTELEALTGLASRRLRQMAKEGVIPHFPNSGEFEGTLQISGVIQYYRQQALAKSTDIEEEKLLLTRAQREKVELENAVTRREMFPADWCGRFLEKVISAIRQKVLACAQLSDTEKDDILNDIANLDADGIVNSIDPQGAGPSEAASEVDGEPVGEPAPIPKPRVKQPRRKISD